MEPNSAAEELPDLYRAVLDRVAQFEAMRQRDLANQIRAEAIEIYSRAWDDRAKRDLQALLRRHAVGLTVRPSLARTFRRRSVRAT
jgi:hypothetical protein